MYSYSTVLRDSSPPTSDRSLSCHLQQLASACNLFELCSEKTHTLKLEDANFSSEAETQRTLRPYKSDAISLQSEAGASAVHAPDEGLVVIIEHDLERSGPPGWYRNFTRAARS